MSKTETPKEDPVADEPVVQAPPKLGATRFVVAVHGDTIHPSTHVRIGVGQPVKAVMDAWYLMQIAAGKVALEG